MASFRHQARIAVMQTIFAYEVHKGEPMETLDYMIAQYPENAEMTAFAKETMEGIIKNKEEILPKIKEFAVEWPLEKIAPIDRAILEIGTFEMLFSRDVPPIVAINEAIEIAKEFGDTNAPKFVNGVLSKILEKYCTNRDHKTGQPV